MKNRLINTVLGLLVVLLISEKYSYITFANKTPPAVPFSESVNCAENSFCDVDEEYLSYLFTCNFDLPDNFLPDEQIRYKLTKIEGFSEYALFVIKNSKGIGKEEFLNLMWGLEYSVLLGDHEESLHVIEKFMTVYKLLTNEYNVGFWGLRDFLDFLNLDNKSTNKEEVAQKIREKIFKSDFKSLIFCLCKILNQKREFNKDEITRENFYCDKAYERIMANEYKQRFLQTEKEKLCDFDKNLNDLVLPNYLKPEFCGKNSKFLSWSFFELNDNKGENAGAKIYITPSIRDAASVACTVRKYLEENKICFKISKNLATFRRLCTSCVLRNENLSQVGKLITIYPKNKDDAVKIATDIDRFLSHLEQHDSFKSISDFIFGKSNIVSLNFFDSFSEDNSILSPYDNFDNEFFSNLRPEIVDDIKDIAKNNPLYYSGIKINPDIRESIFFINQEDYDETAAKIQMFQRLRRLTVLGEKV